MLDPDATKMSGLLRKLIRLLWTVVSELQEFLSDDQQRASIIKSVGLNESLSAPPPVDVNSIEKVEAYLASDSADVLAFLDAASTLATVFDILEVHITPFLEGNEAQSPAREVLYQLLQLSALRIVRRRAPITYAVSRAVGFLCDFSATHELPSFSWENTKRVWSPLKTEEDAFKRSDMLYLTQVASLALTRYITQGSPFPHRPDHVLAGWDQPTPLPGQALSLADSISDRALSWSFAKPFDAGTSLGLTTTWILVPQDHGGPGLFLALRGDLNIDLPEPKTDNTDTGEKAITSVNERLAINFNMPGGASFFLPFDGSGFQVDADPVVQGSVEYLRGNVLNGVPVLAADSGFWQWLEIGAVGVSAALSPNEASVRINLRDVVINISSDDADSFLASAFPSGGLQVKFDLDIGYDIVEGGLFFGGSSRLDAVIPVSKSIGGLSVSQLLVALRVPNDDERKLSFSMLVGVALKIGPLTGVIDQLGYGMTMGTDSASARLGLVDTPEFNFLSPQGIGLAIKCGLVNGAGFLYFNSDQQSYAGVLSLKVGKRFSLTVVGLVNTDVREFPGFSLLAIGSLTGLKLPFFAGGTITGLGVVVGMHRSLSVDALQNSIKNRTLDAILFPADPVGNAPRLIRSLSTFFPVAIDQWVIGITVQANWLSQRQVKIELGLLIEFPNPTRVALVGQVAIGFPSLHYPVTALYFDIAGVADLPAKTVSFDGALYDSYIAGAVLDGQFALRARYGDNREFAVAIGGMNPRFRLPSEFPEVQLLSIALGRGNNPRLRGYGYLGFTTNTAQFGVGAEFYVAAGGFSVEADVRLDLLFQRSPYWFIGELDIGASIKFKGRTLAGIRLTGSIEGPAPWCAQGRFRIKISFLKWNKRFHEQWGDDNRALLEPVNVDSRIRSSLANPDNWGGELPIDQASIVSVRMPAVSDTLDLHPLATLEVEQNVAPLNVDLEIHASAAIVGERRFRITAATVGGESVDNLPAIRAQFAPGQHFDIGLGDDAIARPSFESFVAGARLQHHTIRAGASVSTNFDYEEIIVNQDIRQPDRRRNIRILATLFEAASQRNATSKLLNAQQAYRSVIRPTVQINEGRFVATREASVAVVSLQNDAGDVPQSYTEVLQAIKQQSSASLRASRVQISRSLEAEA